MSNDALPMFGCPAVAGHRSEDTDTFACVRAVEMGRESDKNAGCMCMHFYGNTARNTIRNTARNTIKNTAINTIRNTAINTIRFSEILQGILLEIHTKIQPNIVGNTFIYCLMYMHVFLAEIHTYTGIYWHTSPHHGVSICMYELDIHAYTAAVKAIYCS